MDLEPARHAWLKPSFLHITSGLKARRCPKRTSAWWVRAQRIVLQCINHSRFKTKPLNAIHCVKVMNVVNSLHAPNFTTAQSMSWPGSNQRQPLCLPSVLKPAPGNFCVTLLGHAMAYFKHLKPGHLGTCCLQSHAPGLLALRHHCRAAAAGLTPCWSATPKPKPGQHGW